MCFMCFDPTKPIRIPKKKAPPGKQTSPVKKPSPVEEKPAVEKPSPVEEKPAVKYELSEPVKKSLNQFINHPQAQFIRVVLARGNINVADTVRLRTVTRAIYTEKITSWAGQNIMSLILNMFTSQGSVKFARLSFDPKYDPANKDVNEAERDAFFGIIDSYLSEIYKGKFYSLVGSNAQDLSVEQLEKVYGISYPG